jgi:hypothetical protein
VYTPFRVPIGIFRHPSAATTITRYLAHGIYDNSPIPPINPRVDINPIRSGRLMERNFRTILGTSSPCTNPLAKFRAKKTAKDTEADMDCSDYGNMFFHFDIFHDF